MSSQCSRISRNVVPEQQDRSKCRPRVAGQVEMSSQSRRTSLKTRKKSQAARSTDRNIIEYGHEAKPSILGLQIVFWPLARMMMIVVMIIVRARNNNYNYYGARQKLHLLTFANILGRKGTKNPKIIPPNVSYDNCSHFSDVF